MGALRALWAEPRVVAPPGTRWWDRALVAALVPLAVLETVVRSDVVWPVWHLAWALVCVGALLWRPRWPLAMLVLGYSAQTVAGVVPALWGEPHSVLDVTACVLLLAYSLGRWASGRAILVGTGFLLAVHLAREPLYDSTAASIVIGVGALLFPVALGAAMRFWERAQRRDREDIRMRERQRLARDLHDTVAHHVSGILLEARAAQVRAAADPGEAERALTRMEAAAARSLEDMRVLVAVLREDDAAADRTPTYGAADIVRLGDQGGSAPKVVVTGSPDLGDVSAPVGSALFRVAQEAVTNARRHASGASTVTVHLARDAETVRLRVHDDGLVPSGAATKPRRTTPAYGLAGMRERISLLGGQLRAGPDPQGGWTVDAVVPVDVAAGTVNR